MALNGYVLDGGGPKDSENTLNTFLTKRGGNVFWQIGPEMQFVLIKFHPQILSCCKQLQRNFGLKARLSFWAEIIRPEMQFRPPDVLPLSDRFSHNKKINLRLVKKILTSFP